jgi:glucose 1-dehydrogenase
MPRLQRHAAIVTGSSSGIGQGIAIRLVQEGANLVIDYASHREGAEETLRAVEGAGAKGLIMQADVSKVEAVRALVDRAWEAFGSADLLVNNAGMEKRTDFLETNEADYDRILGVNLKGPFFLTQAFIRKLKSAKKGGRIVNISPVHEDLAFPGFASYCASKGGLRMLMRDLAVELGPIGITVNNIAPARLQRPSTNRCSKISQS